MYVDELPSSGWGRWDGGAHMLGTDLDELHRFAAQLGLRRSWFQGDSTFAHYDLTASKRALAVEAGAVEIEATALPDDVLILDRDNGGYVQRHVLTARREAGATVLAMADERPGCPVLQRGIHRCGLGFNADTCPIHGAFDTVVRPPSPQGDRG